MRVTALRAAAERQSGCATGGGTSGEGGGNPRRVLGVTTMGGEPEKAKCEKQTLAANWERRRPRVPRRELFLGYELDRAAAGATQATKDGAASSEGGENVCL